MRRWWLWVPLAVIGLIIVAIVAIAFIDLGPFIKSRVLAQGREATGREVAIDGDLHLHLLWPTRFEISGLRLANRPGSADPQMVSIGHLAVEVEPWPLLSSQVVVDRIAMSDFKVVLEKDKSGAGNWEMPEKPEEVGHEHKKGESGGGLTIADMRIEHGSIVYIDAGTGQ